MPWDPKLYEKFKNERSLPFYDLADLIAVPNAERVLDLGCGSGELTASLLDRLPRAELLGIDSSPEMLAAARQLARPRLRFVLGDQTKFEGLYDLIISNASVQWSSKHSDLLPSILDHVAPNGQMLLQLPSNHFSPLHMLITETAAKHPFFDQLDGFKRKSPVLSIEEYASILFSYGIRQQIVFEKIYPHILHSLADVLDWISGTALIPYKDRLTADQFIKFKAAIAEQLPKIYPTEPVFYPFKRIFISAIKGI